MIVIEAIPFRSFKEKLELTKENLKLGKVEAYREFIIVYKREKRNENSIT